MREEVDLVTPVERAARLLSSKGLDFYDVTAAHSRSLTVNLLGKGIKDARSTTDLGLGVRAFKNRGTSQAFSQSLKPADVKAVVERAVGFARVAQPDPHFKEIPGPSKAPEVGGVYDAAVEALTLREASGLVRRTIKSVEGVRAGAAFEGGFGAYCGRMFFVASTGVEVETERTYVSVGVMATYREGDDVGSSYEYDYAVSLGEIDFEEVGAKAAKKAVEQFGSRRVESGTLPVVVSPDSSSSLYLALLVAISGSSVVKGRTYASELLGKEVAPPILEIRDDGTIPGAVASDTYDGEGVPKKPVTVVEGGRIRTFLHNSYSAGIAGVETTGHAIRAGYTGGVGAGPTNIRVKPGDSSLGEMIAETRRGILIDHASFNPNMVSGELSSTVDEGFLIEGGERAHPVRNLMMGGHILELYRNIEAVSREGRTLGKGHFFPAVKIRGVKLAGK